MSNWNSGYVSDVDYTYGYYAELNPLRTQFVMLYKGIEYPEYATACELGFGQGLSANIHAAASATKWYGTDFNPAQAAFAQELATAANSGAELYDDSFEKFCTRPELPDFDYICLHGIWSWVSEENRRVIADFIKRKLKVGGVLNISYNAMPGWAAFAPMRHIMTQHSNILGTRGQGVLGRIDGAMNFAKELMDNKPLYSVANPAAAIKLEKVMEQSRNYLAHEYFNRDWSPMYFAEVADWLKEAKLEFACSANYLDQIDPINMQPEQATYLRSIEDTSLQQTARDFIVNTQFRKDYWVRGKRTISSYGIEQRMKKFRVILCCDRSTAVVKAEGALGEAKFNTAIYDPILDVLADRKVKSLEEIADELSDVRDIGYAQILECMLVLINGGFVAPVQESDKIADAKIKTDALNQYLISRVRQSNSVVFLASPVIGGGVSVDQFQQHFLYAISEGKEQPKDWAQTAWEHLSSRGQKLIVEGEQLETAEDNIAELIDRAQKFSTSLLPVLKTLQVI